MNTSLKNMYRVGYLLESSAFDIQSIISYSFAEALNACPNKSLINVSAKACKIARLVLKMCKKSELQKFSESQYWHYYDEMAIPRRSIINDLVQNAIAPAIIIKHQEWREHESIDT